MGLLGEERVESPYDVSEVPFALGKLNMVAPDTTVSSPALLVNRYRVLTDMGQGTALASATAVLSGIHDCGLLPALALRRLELAAAAVTGICNALFGGRAAPLQTSPSKLRERIVRNTRLAQGGLGKRGVTGKPMFSRETRPHA